MDGAERPEQLGQHGGGAAAVAARMRVGEIPHERLGEHGRRLVGVAGAAVQVQVVDRVRVSDPYDDVVRVLRSEPRARRADHDHGGPSGERVQAQRLGQRPHDGPRLAGPGGPDGEQGGAEQVGSEAQSAPR